MSDWLATHSTAPAINAGLDQEMPLGVNFAEAKIKFVTRSNLASRAALHP
jgi:hypothetical protein